MIIFILISLAVLTGLRYLYHGGPFDDWGHFKLNTREFSKNWESMRQCVDIAKAKNIRLGVHTLSNFHHK